MIRRSLGADYATVVTAVQQRPEPVPGSLRQRMMWSRRPRGHACSLSVVSALGRSMWPYPHSLLRPAVGSAAGVVAWKCQGATITVCGFWLRHWLAMMRGSG